MTTLLIMGLILAGLAIAMTAYLSWNMLADWFGWDYPNPDVGLVIWLCLLAAIVFDVLVLRREGVWFWLSLFL